MRLIRPEYPISEPNDTMILVRHGVDLPELTGDLNQPLTEETKPDIKALAHEIILLFQTTNSRALTLRYSTRLRAVETAHIIRDQLAISGIESRMVEANGLREVYQGDFRIENHVTGLEYGPLVKAWTAWQNKLDACELLYRFGDPLRNGSGVAEFPELVGWFTRFGEHQADFSLRLYGALREACLDQSGTVQVLVAHQASCSRIQRIISAASQLITPSDFRVGEFVRYLEKSGRRITIDPACGVVVKRPEPKLFVSILEKEISFLQKIVGTL